MYDKYSSINIKTTIMKQLIQKVFTKFLLSLLVISSSVTFALAQDSGGGSSSSTSSSTTTTTSSTQNWYAQPWVWIVGGAVFILLLVALVRGGKSGDSVSVTRTTTTERNDV